MQQLTKSMRSVNLFPLFPAKIQQQTTKFCRDICKNLVGDEDADTSFHYNMETLVKVIEITP